MHCRIVVLLKKIPEVQILDSESELSVRESPAVAEPSRPPGIGGPLIVMAFGLCLSGLQNLLYFLGSLAPLVRKSFWDRLTDPNSDAYHPHWKPFLIYQGIISLGFLVTNIALLILFFKRKRVFPKLIVLLIPVLFLLSFISYVWSGLIPSVADSAEYTKDGHALIARFVALHVWIPYFLVSKRVKKTFVF
jgi:Protein of unknown function (DUF2569)